MTNNTLLILNGPGVVDLNNVDTGTHDSIESRELRDTCYTLCSTLGISFELREAGNVNEMDRWLIEDSDNFDALIVNPATIGELELSQSATDVLAGMKKPFVEVHINNIFRDGNATRKPLRGPEGQTGFICGLGLRGYSLAIKSIAKRLQR